MRAYRMIVLMAAGLTALSASAGIIKSGTCGKDGGDNVTWTLYDDGLLTFSGTGEMVVIPDYPDWEYCAKNIVVGEGITTIGAGVLGNCLAETLSLPSTLTNIDVHAFYSNSYSKVEVAAGNPVYDSRDNCNAIIETSTDKLFLGFSTTVIPKSVTSIGNDAFLRVSIEEITIPEKVTSIGDYAFFDCYSLTTVNIPASVNSIGKNAYGECASLTSISVDSKNKVYDSRDNSNAIIETATNILLRASASTVIPASVTKIGDDSFSGLDILSVTIPSSVTSIGERAFKHCSFIKSIVIPSGVKEIKNRAFSNCHRMKTVYALGTTPCPLDITEYDAEYCTLYVPEGSEEAYAKADGWKEFKEIKTIPDSSRFDVNKDGKVDISDVTSIVDFIKTQQIIGITQ